MIKLEKQSYIFTADGSGTVTASWLHVTMQSLSGMLRLPIHVLWMFRKNYLSQFFNIVLFQDLETQNDPRNPLGFVLRIFPEVALIAASPAVAATRSTSAAPHAAAAAAPAAKAAEVRAFLDVGGKQISIRQGKPKQNEQTWWIWWASTIRWFCCLHTKIWGLDYLDSGWKLESKFETFSKNVFLKLRWTLHPCSQQQFQIKNSSQLIKIGRFNMFFFQKQQSKHQLVSST